MLEDILREILFAKPVFEHLSKKAHVLDKKIIGMSSIMQVHAKAGDYDSLRRVYDNCSTLIDERFDVEADLEHYKNTII